MITAILLLATGANAAGPFDGDWLGVDPANSQCNSPVEIVLQINNNQITGHVTGARGTGYITPSPIGTNGTAHIVYGGSRLTLEADIRFGGNRFDTDVSSACGGTRHVSGSKR